MNTPDPIADLTLADAEREANLRAEVRALSERCRDARRLTAEVCQLLFHRHGEVPNANRIYSLTRRGSLTTIAEEVAAFWEDIRSKSRIRLTVPELLPELGERLGDFLSALIASIEDRVAASFEADRQALDLARQDLVGRETEWTEQRQRILEEDRQRLAEAENRAMRAETARHATLENLAAERATGARLRSELEAALAQAEAARLATERAREAFASDLTALRESLVAAETRAAGAELRALRDIEAERMAARKIHTQLERANQARDTLKQRVEALEAEVMRLSQEQARSAGHMDAVREERDRWRRLYEAAMEEPARRGRENPRKGGRGLSGRSRWPKKR